MNPMTILTTLLVLLYTLPLTYIFLFSLSQLHLTWIYSFKKRTGNYSASMKDPYPTVTIQLPVFNEKYVVERLIDSILLLDYPKENIDIQILDDSTDETTDLIQKKLNDFKEKDFNFFHIQRLTRQGYKAGALAHAIQFAKGEFIAIFDADFIPPPNFLLKTIPHFSDETLAVVQTRWGHLNKDFSFLTQLQAFGLDAHFTIEQGARNSVGSFINFNGTCGVWRKSAIENAGGWSSETLTEDLDLSYRAQLNNWKFLYDENFSTPGELPILMSAVKSQQYRWNKGGAETARKMFGKVLFSNKSITQKIHAFFHLFNSSIFVAILMASILSIPMLLLKANNPSFSWAFRIGNIFLLGFLSITIFYWVAFKKLPASSIKKFIRLFIPFIVLSMGLSLHNGIAVLEGLFGKKTSFIRTPKFNVKNKDSWKMNTYIQSSITRITIMESLLCIYFIYGIILGFQLSDYGLILFHSMLAIGFGSIVYLTIKPLRYC